MRNAKTQQMIVRQDKDTMDDSQISPNVSLFNPDGTPYRPEGSAELDLSEFPDPSWLVKAMGGLNAMPQEEMVTLFRGELRTGNDYHTYNVNRVAATGANESLSLGVQYHYFSMDQNCTINIGSTSGISANNTFAEAFLLLDGEFTPAFANVTWLNGPPVYTSSTIYHFCTFDDDEVIYGSSISAAKGDPGQINVSAPGSFSNQTITVPSGSDILSFGNVLTGSDVTVPDVTITIPNGTEAALTGVLTLVTTYNLVGWPSSDDGDAVVALELQINAEVDGDPWDSTNDTLKATSAVFAGSSVLPSILGEITFTKEATIPTGGAALVIEKLGNFKCSVTPTDAGYIYFVHRYSFISG